MTQSFGRRREETTTVRAWLGLVAAVWLASTVLGGLALGGKWRVLPPMAVVQAIATSPVFIAIAVWLCWQLLLLAAAMWVWLDWLDRSTPIAALFVGAVTGVLAWLHPGRTVFPAGWALPLFLILGGGCGWLLWRIAYRRGRVIAPVRNRPPLVLAD